MLPCISNLIEVIRPHQTKRDLSFTSGSWILSCDSPLGHKDKQLLNGSIRKLSDDQNGTIGCCSAVLCNFSNSCRLPKIHQTLWGWRLRIYEFSEETFLTWAIQVTGVLSESGDYILFYPNFKPVYCVYNMHME